ncbi:acyltransferase family protein [Aromatoleum bremense]|uniref:Acyltransferase family protein n=1 Tax=Aromatoleum bremense TaxID=76115 RepID=A0ABX1NWE6_9RHOO|nr:acyltransferase [Aromatoleum bremense]NMG16354.1 acyltransferase family protein [Aromatoleum bremense]QTQ32648.1 Acyltransferase 3 domain-containing protein [Aromatoleum bremense]
MGSLRFVLACLVLASHLGHSVSGLNPGVTAVVVFYLLAGHVVGGLWEKWRSQPHALRQFYADRLWRVLPQYYAALGAAALLWAAGAQSPFLALAPGPLEWVINLVVLPLAYFMYTGKEGFALVPPAWSLAVEIQFYLLAPWLAGLTAARLGGAILASLLVFTAAQLQWLDADHFGYRLLPGVLFIFLAGAGLRRPALRPALLALWAVIVLYTVLLRWTGHYIPFNQEVALGVSLGVPVLEGLRRIQPRGRLKAFDEQLASLSYGVFLWHFPVTWLLELNPPILTAGAFATVLGLATACAFLSHHGVERPLWRRFRHMTASAPRRPY